MSDLTATVDTYLAAWNETDPARRAELVEQVWAPDGTLTDPPLRVGLVPGGEVGVHRAGQVAHRVLLPSSMPTTLARPAAPRDYLGGSADTTVHSGIT